MLGGKGTDINSRQLYIFLWKRKCSSPLGTGIFVHKRIISAVRRIEFVSDKMYITLNSRWCDVIVLNVHAPPEGKDGDIKESFYEELEQVFYQFRRYHLKILLADFNAKI
jgi:hypothetical protein